MFVFLSNKDDFFFIFVTNFSFPPALPYHVKIIIIIIIEHDTMIMPIQPIRKKKDRLNFETKITDMFLPVWVRRCAFKWELFP